jgi:hypothetical protein
MRLLLLTGYVLLAQALFFLTGDHQRIGLGHAVHWRNFSFFAMVYAGLVEGRVCNVILWRRDSWPGIEPRMRTVAPSETIGEKLVAFMEVSIPCGR